MNDVTIKMLKIYKPFSCLDWMNYKINDLDKLTFHHIKKKVNKGREDVDNGAILMRHSHTYLHLIELLDPDTYVELNDIFMEVNDQNSEPTLEQRIRIENVLKNFEKEHRYDKEHNKLLIKHKYLKREKSINIKR